MYRPYRAVQVEIANLWYERYRSKLQTLITSNEGGLRIGPCPVWYIPPVPYRFGRYSNYWFAISIFTARYGRYILVRQVAGTRTAHYRAVPPKIDRWRSISAVGGRLKGEIDRRRSIE
ncbi:hypothetical protein BHE74_00045292 [Ensete ventricosum]|nr:hypothetical protein BHE74_00045292 [Ensete ventricosum]